MVESAGTAISLWCVTINTLSTSVSLFEIRLRILSQPVASRPSKISSRQSILQEKSENSALKTKERRENPYRIVLKRNDNVKWH